MQGSWNDVLSLLDSLLSSLSLSLSLFLDSDNRIGDDGATCLSTSLAGLTSMQTLNIRCVLCAAATLGML